VEKIIASEIAPNGLDSEIFCFLEDHIDDLGLADSIIYYGFPVFKDYEDSSVKSKFCILSKIHGIVLINTTSQHELIDDDDNLSQLFSFIESALKKSKKIRINKKKLAINLDSYLYIHDFKGDGETENELLTSFSDITKVFKTIAEDGVDVEILDEVRSIIEGSKALSRVSKRTRISDDPTTKLNILIELEKEVSNFDVEQRKIAISLINGPQRIRGLAGSGKTVVLAMKAAHIHLQHPTKKILFTFYTKSLYGLIKESIARFYRHFAGDEPNWDFIDVLHAWGGQSIDGVCFNACADNYIATMSFPEAKRINQKDPFSVVCKHIESKEVKSKYDYILIDEAQDLPNEFFHLCYKLAKGELGNEKNIVWAYD
jgi:superfamily I DNA and RNA helicase